MMYSNLKYLYLLITSILLHFHVNSQSIVKKLHEDLFKNYDPESRPVKHASNLTEICSGLVFSSILIAIIKTFL